MHAVFRANIAVAKHNVLFWNTLCIKILAKSDLSFSVLFVKVICDSDSPNELIISN